MARVEHRRTLRPKVKWPWEKNHDAQLDRIENDLILLSRKADRLMSSIGDLDSALTTLGEHVTALKTAVDGDAPEKKLGIKAVKTVLKKFGVTESPALVGEQFAPCLEAIAAAMPKEDETF